MKSSFMNLFRSSSGEQIVTLYHGTPYSFNKFALSSQECGIHFGSKFQALSRLKDIAEPQEKLFLLKVNIKVRKTLIVHDDIFYNNAFSFFRKLCQEDTVWEGRGTILNDDEEGLLCDKWEDDFKRHDYEKSSNDYEFYRDVEKILIDRGYDSIKYFNTIETGAMTRHLDISATPIDDEELYSLCALKPDQIEIVEVVELRSEELSALLHEELVRIRGI